MSKRSRSDISKEEFDRKIRKYEKKILKMRNRRPLRTPTPIEDVIHLSSNEEMSISNNKDDKEEQEEETLDQDIINILGDAPEECKFGPSIHKELASRWTDVIRNGLARETRAAIKKKYLPPQNCRTAAPRLNLEAQAAVTDIVVKRDKAIANKQDQVGCALAALAKVFGEVIKNKENLQAINLINDAGRLLCDHQYQESMTRRNFILQSLDQTTKDAVKETKIDEWLFGESFSEKLKAAKAIKKSGLEISISKAKKPQQQTQRRSLNFKGPVINPSRSQRYPYQAGPQKYFQTYKNPRAQVPISQKARAQSKAPLRSIPNRN
ncbi:uncharacterized protein [Epargyreus clarus]|uniref:uncharacterized protein n=1 Tax=Epargyreus clarus TaxID=520877 RepID=UPI003C30308F